MCVCVSTICMHGAGDVWRGCPISWNWACRWLWAIMCLLSMKLGSSRGAVSTLNYRSNLSSPSLWILNQRKKSPVIWDFCIGKEADFFSWAHGLSNINPWVYIHQRWKEMGLLLYTLWILIYTLLVFVCKWMVL